MAFDLALDLVLNEVVEQARKTTGATGAAIALARNGVMECRATTGQHAPDLGVRVETQSGLSGACLRSGEIQHCSDTERDPRVDAETCRQLGVRSMLIIPLSDGSLPFGIVEVLSSRSSAFSGRDIEMLQSLARRIVASKREAEEGAMHDLVSVEEDSHVLMPPGAVDAHPQNVAPVELVEQQPEPASKGDVWTTVLVILVIAAAVALGVLIGWRGAAKRRITQSQPPVKPQTAEIVVPVPLNPAVQSSAPASAQSTSVSAATGARNVSPVSEPMGGLLVTQNGKVIYRESATQLSAGGSAPAVRIVRRVDPEYPVEARNRNIQGPVVLDVQVLTDGTVGTIGIVSGDPLLTESAVHAVRQWKYQPNVMNGRPIEGQTRIKINFTLPPAN